MALIDLLNNDPKFFYYSGQGNFTQKSIAYGNDLQGGGSSNQPYVQFPLPENASNNTKRYYELNRTGNDYPLRGGNGTNISLTGATVPEAAKIDRLRIQQFLKSSKGNIFLLKQKDLQFANPKMEVGEAAVPFNQQVGTLYQGGIEYTRVYNDGRNTLAQVGVQGSGFHYDRHGLRPVNPFQLTYEYTVKNKDKELNRLIFLYKTKLAEDPDVNFANFSTLGVSTSNDLLLEYLGGPDSIGGLGFTTIERKVYSDQSDIDLNKGNINNNVNTFNYNQLSNPLEQNSINKIRPDFRSEFASIASSNYEENSLSTKYKIGDPGSNAIIRINYSTSSDEGLDQLNYADAVRISNVDPWENGTAYDDLIKFGFEAIDNSNPSDSIFIQFRAFLNSFRDSHQANYNSVKYIGRGESFYAYDGFTRSIGFGFIIAAQTRQELIPLYDKLNILASQIYPDYGQNSFMKTPVVKLTIGDYIYRQPGFLNNIELSIETDYPWEIKLDKEGEDRDIYQLPQIIKAECQFTPIHDFLPKKTPGLGNITPLINSKRYRITQENPSVPQALQATALTPVNVPSNNVIANTRINPITERNITPATTNRNTNNTATTTKNIRKRINTNTGTGKKASVSVNPYNTVQGFRTNGGLSNKYYNKKF